MSRKAEKKVDVERTHVMAMLKGRPFKVRIIASQVKWEVYGRFGEGLDKWRELSWDGLVFRTEADRQEAGFSDSSFDGFVVVDPSRFV